VASGGLKPGSGFQYRLWCGSGTWGFLKATMTALVLSQKLPEISGPSSDVLADAVSSVLLSKVPDSLSCLGRQGGHGEGALSSLLFQCSVQYSDLAEFDKGEQQKGGKRKSGAVCILDGLVGESREALYPPLCTYSSTVVGKPGYSDWVVQCAKEIYPIVGM
jgi:hypothetical protein